MKLLILYANDKLKIIEGQRIDFKDKSIFSEICGSWFGLLNCSFWCMFCPSCEQLVIDELYPMSGPNSALNRLGGLTSNVGLS